jgi:hypothetical protein
MARVLVVPWSMAITYWFMVTSLSVVRSAGSVLLRGIAARWGSVVCGGVRRLR